MLTFVFFYIMIYTYIHAGVCSKLFILLTEADASDYHIALRTQSFDKELRGEGADILKEGRGKRH